ncbi:MAG: gliding motility lipoprotein GldD [Bacteroides sp.]
MRQQRGVLGFIGLFVLVVALIYSFALTGCSDAIVPRSCGYPRFDFPTKNYRHLDTILPYTFDLPLYARLRIDPDSMAQDIEIPQYKATIYLTYYNRASALDTLTENARTLTYKHSTRADAIDEQYYEDPERRVYAMLYRVAGDVATSVQFYATDSVSHFLRGTLYFYCVPNADSLAPAIDFFSQDVVRLIETLAWKE